MTLHRFMKKHRACEESFEYLATQPDDETAIWNCPEADWADWLVSSGFRDRIECFWGHVSDLEMLKVYPSGAWWQWRIGSCLYVCADGTWYERRGDVEAASEGWGWVNWFADTDEWWSV